MGTVVGELHPDLVDWPDTRPVRGALVPVVNTLREQDRVIATLGDLAELLPRRAPQSTARALREAGWLFPIADPRCVGVLRSPSWYSPGAGVCGAPRPDAGTARHPGVQLRTLSVYTRPGVEAVARLTADQFDGPAR